MNSTDYSTTSAATTPLLADPKEADGIENLYPALTQCFAIILCGYVAGRTNLISETEAKGINALCGYFALPSIIFMALVQTNLNTVNWSFLLAILIAKSIVFFSVITIHVLVRKSSNLGSAGLFAIFCTQSNDFAIGYPIVAALYKNTHPNYASYLYLVAPVNLAILNPFAFVLLEINKSKNNAVTNLSINADDEPTNRMHRRKCVMVLKLVRNIFLNPVIMMTILGIAGNFIFRNTFPVYLGNILNTLGSAFPASALFLLGLRMVGQARTFKGITLVIPGLLIIAKLMVLPLVIRETVNILHAGGDVNNTSEISTYGFLYGTLPSAPFAFVIASQYGVDVDLIATSMVACTFISAPIMFISAKMITLTKTDPSQYIKQLNSFTFDISIAGLIASVWVLMVYILTKKFKKIPHKFTACLVVSQLLSCVGAILWNTLDMKTGFVGQLQFAIFTIGVFSSRIWTAILAMTLLFLQCRNLCHVLFKLQTLFMISGFGLPIVLAVLLLFLDRDDTVPFDKRNPNFVYGIYQAIIAVSLLVLCFVVTLGCLIFHQRYRKRYQNYWTLSQEVAQAIDDAQTDYDSEPNTTQTTYANLQASLTVYNASNGGGPPGTATTYSSTSDTYLANAHSMHSECSGENMCYGTGKCANAATKCNLPTIRESTEDSPPSAPVADIEDMFVDRTRELKKATKANTRANASKPNLTVLSISSDSTWGDDSTDNVNQSFSKIEQSTTSSEEIVESRAAQTLQSGPQSNDSSEDSNEASTSTTTTSVDEDMVISTNKRVSLECARPRRHPSDDSCPSGMGCAGPTSEQCRGIMQQYEERIDDDLELIEEDPNSHDPQILRHSVLLILLLCSMFIGLAISTWTLVMEKMSGIYIELSFLDAALNFGQSIIVFAVFGTDTKEVMLPMLKYWRKMWFGASTLNLPMYSELSTETKHICEQFTAYHLDKCKVDIAKNKRWRLKVYRKVFSGTTFVDWLIELGLARDRTEAINYARHLIEGKVLRHINSVYHFYDRNLLYTFN